MSYFRLEDALPNPGLTGDTSTTGLLPWSAPPTPPQPYDWSAMLDALGGPVGPAGVTPDWAAMVRAFDPARWSRAPTTPSAQPAAAAPASLSLTRVALADPTVVSDVPNTTAADSDATAAAPAQLAANVAVKHHAAASSGPTVLPPDQQARNVAIAREALSHPEVQAFLDALATGESGDRDNVLNGGKRFTGSRYPSGAKLPAGAYQIKPRTYDENQAELGLPDFLHDSQKVMAAHIMRKKGAIEPLLKGNLEGAMKVLRGTWTSLPGTNEHNSNTDSFKDRYAATLGLLRAQQVPYP